MTRASDRASRLREFKDRDDEYRETGDKEAAVRRFQAMRSKDVRMTDWERAQESLVGRSQDEVCRSKELAKKLGARFEREK